VLRTRDGIFLAGVIFQFRETEERVEVKRVDN